MWWCQFQGCIHYWFCLSWSSTSSQFSFIYLPWVYIQTSTWMSTSTWSQFETHVLEYGDVHLSARSPTGGVNVDIEVQVQFQVQVQVQV